MVMEQRHPLLRNGIVYAEGSKWRNIRRSLASAFTHGKLKQMMADVKNGADTFLDIVSEYADSNREANVFELYQRLAMDYVGRTAFGVDFSFQRGPENALAVSSKAILRGVMKGPFYFICQCTSKFGVFAKPLYWVNMLLGVYASVALTKETANVIDLRRNNPEFRKADVLQNLLDAEYQEESPETDNGSPQNARTLKSRALTKEEILVSAASTFIAGYDTTSTSLSYVTYLLAKHQDVQERVRREANEVFSSEASTVPFILLPPQRDDEECQICTGGVGLRNCDKEAAILKSSRQRGSSLVPPVLTFTSRKAVNDFEHNGVQYKAGTCFSSPILQVHRDARYWPDPLNFNPDRWRKRHFSYFKNLGIPGPEPSLLWGNIREFHETDHYKVIGKWLEKYGDTFGFYDGDVPFVVTKDLDFLEYILIRNFQNFTGRGETLVVESSECSRDLQRLTLDYVGRGAFGVDGSFQIGPENSLAASARAVISGVMKGPLHFLCQSTSTLGVLATPLYWINMIFSGYVTVKLTKETARIIDLRKQNPEFRKPDVLQNLLDAEYQEESPQTDNDTLMSGKGAEKAIKSRVLTKDEVLLSASVLFVAGYDTTSTSLSYVTYLLAKHQDVQDRVRKEFNEAISGPDDFDYETITRKLPYLTQVVSEALRLYPPVLTFVTRKAVEDFEFNGVHYKAGTSFLSPTLQIHRDSRYWPDPLTFNPDRFAAENEGSFHNVAYQAFGVGPRNCIGMRMAQMALYYTIARLVQRFQLHVGPSQPEESFEIVSRAVLSKTKRWTMDCL
nr:cytochrome P450 3A14-like [Rhipicephalus microplus]